jgi:hypothetical protein
MSGLPTWAIGSIVAASAILGPVVAFLVAWAVALLIRRLTGVSEPAMVLAAVGEIGNLRRGWSRGTLQARSERVRPGSAVAAPPG